MSGFLPRWSVDVWLVVLAALRIAAVTLALGIMFAHDLLAGGELSGEAREVILPSIVALFTWLWVLATCAYLAWAVIHRRFKFNDLRIMLCFGWLFLWICGSLAGGLVDFFDHGGPPALALGDPPASYQHLVGELFIPFVAVSLCSWAAAFRTFRSGDLLRWAMPGEASDGLRARVHASLGTPLSYTAQSRQIEAGDVTFSLYHHPADAGVAREVAAELAPSGLLRPGWRLQQDAGDSATPVAILSNFTARDWVTETLGRAGPRPVCVAATSLDLPSDIAWVRRFQWVDYRLRSRDQLDSLVGSVRILPVVPESLAKLRAPRRIMAVAYALKFLATLSLASGISDALLTAMDMRDSLNQARAALGMAGGGLMFWLAHRVLARTIALPVFLGLAIIGWIMILASHLAANLSVMFSTYQLGNINLYSVMWVGGPALVVVAAIDMLGAGCRQIPDCVGAKRQPCVERNAFNNPALTLSCLCVLRYLRWNSWCRGPWVSSLSAKIAVN
jgi:hypothetical protein